MRTKTQLYHYLLSFSDKALIDWYNNNLVDAFGDYSEQTIMPLCDTTRACVLGLYGMERLCSVMREKKTRIFDEDKYIAICGGDTPYIITFSSFEEFLVGENKESVLNYVMEYPEVLETLEEMAEEQKEK